MATAFATKQMMRSKRENTYATDEPSSSGKRQSRRSWSTAPLTTGPTPLGNEGGRRSRPKTSAVAPEGKMSPGSTMSRPRDPPMVDDDVHGTLAMERALKTNSTIPRVNNSAVLPADTQCMVIDPQSAVWRQWDLLVIWLLLYTAIVTPVEVAFIESTFGVQFIINRFIDLAFMIDLVLNFFTARFDEDIGMWRYRLGDIARTYLKGWFWIDFLSVLPFDVIGVLMDSESVSQLRIFRVIRLLRLMKLVRILKASRILARWEHRISMSYSLMSLFKFMIGVTVVAHWMACAWRIVVDIEDAHSPEGLPVNWLTQYDVGSSWHNEYISSVYWSVMTITTIGYGDVVPQTDGERIMATLMMMVGASIYAYVVGNVCGIVGNLDESTSKFHATMDHLNSYMAEYRLPQELRESLRSYFIHCRALQREKEYKELLDHMSPHLRGQVTLHCYAAWIRNIPFFNVDTRQLAGYERYKAVDEAQHFIAQIAMKITPNAFGPNEMIIKVNDPADRMFIIKRGIVAKHGTIIGNGQYVGEDMILEAYARPYVVRTLTYVDCFRLLRDDLVDLFQHGQFPYIRKAIRLWSLKLAFRLKFVAYSRAYQGFREAIARHREAKHESESLSTDGSQTVTTETPAQPGQTTGHRTARRRSLQITKQAVGSFADEEDLSARSSDLARMASESLSRRDFDRPTPTRARVQSTTSVISVETEGSSSSENEADEDAVVPISASAFSGTLADHLSPARVQAHQVARSSVANFPRASVLLTAPALPTHDAPEGYRMHRSRSAAAAMEYGAAMSRLPSFLPPQPGAVDGERVARALSSVGNRTRRSSPTAATEHGDSTATPQIPVQFDLNSMIEQVVQANATQTSQLLSGALSSIEQRLAALESKVSALAPA